MATHNSSVRPRLPSGNRIRTARIAPAVTIRGDERSEEVNRHVHRSLSRPATAGPSTTRPGSAGEAARRCSVRRPIRADGIVMDNACQADQARGRDRALFKPSSSRCRSLTKRRRSDPTPPGGSDLRNASVSPLFGLRFLHIRENLQRSPERLPLRDADCPTLIPAHVVDVDTEGERAPLSRAP